MYNHDRDITDRRELMCKYGNKHNSNDIGRLIFYIKQMLWIWYLKKAKKNIQLDRNIIVAEEVVKRYNKRYIWVK